MVSSIPFAPLLTSYHPFLFCSCITRDGHQIALVKTGKVVLVVHLTRMVDQVAAVLGTKHQPRVQGGCRMP
jgi:hypothetical protein